MNINWEFIQGSWHLYLKATELTLRLAFWGIVISVIIGIICSVILYFKVKVLKQIVSAYIELSRNTPLLIQLFFLYYGLPRMGIKLSATTCAIIGLSFLGGSYMAESFRSGLEAVSKSQIESGLSIGLTRFQLIRYIIFPQAFSVSLPSLGANGIFLLKETSILGAIAIPELMFIAKDLIGIYYTTFESLAMLIIAYLVILLPLSLILTFFEKKVRYAEFGN